MSRDVHGRTSVAEDRDVRERPDIQCRLDLFLGFDFVQFTAEEEA
jgi:hypothetical protein